jgi:hypothetical protein
MLRQGADGFTSLRRKACCGFLSLSNIHRPRPVLNPRTLGLMSSTLTTTPPRTTGYFEHRKRLQKEILVTLYIELLSLRKECQVDWNNAITWFSRCQLWQHRKNKFRSRALLPCFKHAQSVGWQF